MLGQDITILRECYIYRRLLPAGGLFPSLLNLRAAVMANYNKKPCCRKEMARCRNHVNATVGE